MWHLASRQLNKYLLTNFINNPAELFEVVKGFIEAISVSMINHLINGMTNRISEVRRLEGGHTNTLVLIH